jgi:hypothetical protein
VCGCGGGDSGGSGSGGVGGGDRNGCDSDGNGGGGGEDSSAPFPSLSVRSNSYAALELGLALALWGLSQACVVSYARTYAPGGPWDVGSLHLGLSAGLPLGAGLAMLAFCVACGTAYLEQPQLWAGSGEQNVGWFKRG